jgi:hypothetical protein
VKVYRIVATDPYGEFKFAAVTAHSEAAALEHLQQFWFSHQKSQLNIIKIYEVTEPMVVVLAS